MGTRVHRFQDPLDVNCVERLRIKAGLSKTEVMRRSGLNRRTVWRIEDELYEPMAGTLFALAEVYGIEPGELLAMIREELGDRRRQHRIAA